VGAAVDKAQFDRLEVRVDAAARHACRALLAMDGLRTSSDPAERATYRNVHDLIGDLGSLRLELDQLPIPPDAAA